MGYVNSSTAVAPAAGRGMLSPHNVVLPADNALPLCLRLPLLAFGEKPLAYLLL
jgi:hypothetical protein